jgi:hypothetical protein
VRVLLPLLCWAVGIFATSYPTLLSGFAEVQGGLGDSRLVNFTLEHSYRWLAGMPLAEDLFSPPIFYPVQDVASYTDLMLGFGPLYWPWRLAGASPHTAYQLWMLCCWSLNFWVALYVLVKGFRVSAVGAAAGAYLFAFGGPRLANLIHQQLVPQFFLLMTLLAICELVRGMDRTPRPLRDWWWSAVLAGTLVLQLASAVYPLIFFVLAAAGVAAAITLRAEWRRTASRLARRYALPLIVCGVVAAAVATPLVLRYLETANMVGMRGYSTDNLPRLLSWFLMAKTNWLYGWLHGLPSLDWASMSPHHNGIGLVATVAAALGLWHHRRRPAVQLMVLAICFLFLVTLRMPGDWSLWAAVRELMPGARALRAVGRVGLMAVFPAALGLGLAIDRMRVRRHWVWAVVLFAVVATEQFHLPLSFDKEATEKRVARLAGSVPPDAEAFLLVLTVKGRRYNPHNDAAWVALASGIPTVNGRYGNHPRGWPLREVDGTSPQLRARIRQDLRMWIELHDLDGDRIAWVSAPPGPTRR